MKRSEHDSEKPVLTVDIAEFNRQFTSHFISNLPGFISQNMLPFTHRFVTDRTLHRWVDGVVKFMKLCNTIISGLADVGSDAPHHQLWIGDKLFIPNLEVPILH